MRVAVAVDDPSVRSEVLRALEAGGHAAARASPRGRGLAFSLLRSSERFDAVVISLHVRGNEWCRLLRQLRQRAPKVLILVVLPPGHEQAWPHALRAGAFDAVATAGGPAAILYILDRAQAYRGGAVHGKPRRSRRWEGTDGAGSKPGSGFGRT